MASEGTARTAESKIASVRNGLLTWYLTIRLSDARLRNRQTKMLFPDHRLPPWLTEDAPRDRSNRLLDIRAATPHPGVPWDCGSPLEAAFALLPKERVVLAPNLAEYALRHPIKWRSEPGKDRFSRE